MTARLDYGFARRHGVILLDTDDGAPECAHLAKAPLSALLEAQRCANRASAFRQIDATAFDTALSGLYSNSATQAAQIAAEDDTDLTALADETLQRIVADDLTEGQVARATVTRSAQVTTVAIEVPASVDEIDANRAAVMVMTAIRERCAPRSMNVTLTRV